MTDTKTGGAGPDHTSGCGADDCPCYLAGLKSARIELAERNTDLLTAATRMVELFGPNRTGGDRIADPDRGADEPEPGPWPACFRATCAADGDGSNAGRPACGAHEDRHSCRRRVVRTYP